MRTFHIGVPKTPRSSFKRTVPLASRKSTVKRPASRLSIASKTPRSNRKRTVEDGCAAEAVLPANMHTPVVQLDGVRSSLPSRIRPSVFVEKVMPISEVIPPKETSSHRKTPSRRKVSGADRDSVTELPKKTPLRHRIEESNATVDEDDLGLLTAAVTPTSRIRSWRSKTKRSRDTKRLAMERCARAVSQPKPKAKTPKSQSAQATKSKEPVFLEEFF